METKTPTVSLLEASFPTVMKLHDYLLRLSETGSFLVLQKEGDPLVYRNLVQTAYVATDFSFPMEKGIPMGTMSEFPSMEPPTMRDVS